MKNNNFRYEQAEMVDYESGRLLGFIPEDFGIWVPPDTVFASESGKVIKNVFMQSIGIKGDPCIGIFIPEDWVVKGYKPAWRTRLQEIRWIKKDKTENLLDEFIGLAEAKTEKYLRFAKKWGPLWEQVRSPFEENYANISPQSEMLIPWFESTELWRMNAKEVKGFLDIAAHLHSGKPAPLDFWESANILIEEEKLDNIIKQRHWFSIFLTGKLSKEYRTWFRLDWSAETPNLMLTTKLGFIHSVWFQLLQAVAKMQVYICDSCGKVYVRNSRKPAKGRNNYCPACGVNASKRLWAAKEKTKS